MSPRIDYRERKGLAFVQVEVSKSLLTSLVAALPDVPRSRIVRRALSELNHRLEKSGAEENPRPAAA